jgi:Uma2 family endonuclease
MAEIGIFARDARIELIKGEIVDMTPIGSEHASVVKHLTELFYDALHKRAVISVQDPITLPDHSEPEPDLALVRRRDDYYAARHPYPEDVYLIIEVADSSLIYDRDIKMPLYAEHSITEAWLIDLNSRLLNVYHTPLDGRYTCIVQPDLSEPMALQALPDVVVDLSELFR